jgi:hypothetical protein
LFSESGELLLDVGKFAAQVSNVFFEMSDAVNRRRSGGH